MRKMARRVTCYEPAPRQNRADLTGRVTMGMKASSAQAAPSTRQRGPEMAASDLDADVRKARLDAYKAELRREIIERWQLLRRERCEIGSVPDLAGFTALGLVELVLDLRRRTRTLMEELRRPGFGR